MPRHRPAASGYARLAQADEDDRSHGVLDDSDDEDVFGNPMSLTNSNVRYTSIQPPARDNIHLSGQASPSSQRKRTPGRKRVRRSSSGVDIKAINARLERWAEEIASKFKINKVKGKTQEEEQLEIHHSVFQAPNGTRPVSAESLASYMAAQNSERMTKAQFEEIVESVRVAIEMGVHPKMISQGSSGSYFARNADGKVVGVFKPKDEEPYASRNPKWTKWIHRNLFPCFFGRACLIPNLSYVSEAAAYVLDARLQTNLVPYTDIVYLSSKSFHYDFWDRRSYWRGKQNLPAKVGSFQVFLKGFKDANIFLREHPWPDQINQGFNTEDAPKRRTRPWADCRPGGAESDDEDDNNNVASPVVQETSSNRAFRWTDTIKQAFREELEKLVILDYIMRNTDRGLDNWMIKIDWQTEEVSIVSDPPKLNGPTSESAMRLRPTTEDHERPMSDDLKPYRRHESMVAASRTGTPPNSHDINPPSISIGAIDNSLSWPWKHPDAWRSFPFGWLFLPVTLIGQPFTKKTRDHFLPLLTSTAWWSGTQLALRRVFNQDSDFKESMFARQMAVMKGQAWNVVETLKQADHGPLELTRRTRVCVWDDLVDVPVAIPLRVSSSEFSRKRNMQQQQQEEEMDISAALASEPARQPPQDLLAFGSPTNELPNPNRFELSRDQGPSDSGNAHEEPSSPITIGGPDYMNHQAQLSAMEQAKYDLSQSLTLPPRPSANKPRTRFSFEFPRAANKKQNSRSGGRSTPSAAFYDGDDLEGDLGYAAAEGMEGNQRKVIVERLEAVKSNNPVFTWC